jgi:hypothetical protein
MLQMVCASLFDIPADPLSLATAWYFWATCSRLLTWKNRRVSRRYDITVTKVSGIPYKRS